MIPAKDKLTEDEKIEILRDLSAEYAKAKTYLPRSKKPLEYDVDGTWDQADGRCWRRAERRRPRVGDQIKITRSPSTATNCCSKSTAA